MREANGHGVTWPGERSSWQGTEKVWLTTIKELRHQSTTHLRLNPANKHMSAFRSGFSPSQVFTLKPQPQWHLDGSLVRWDRGTHLSFCVLTHRNWGNKCGFSFQGRIIYHVIIDNIIPLELVGLHDLRYKQKSMNRTSRKTAFLINRGKLSFHELLALFPFYLSIM